MTRIAIVLVIALASLGRSGAAEIIDVSTRKQLFVDDHVVAKQSGLTRVVQQPTRVGEKPILTADQPWEGNILQMPCVLWDPGLRIYHMYYWAVVGDSIYTCYARSQDGQQWDKPMLNLHAGPDGSKENNIVLRGEGNVARTRYVVLNPRTDDPKRRFLALYIDNVPNLTEFAASSPDGLNWITEKKIGDLRHVTGSNATSNPPFFLIEQQWGKDPKDGHRYRAIWRTESQDMKNWSGGQLVIERQPDDNPDLEFYHACSHFLGSQTYAGIHFGYLYLFHSESTRGVRNDRVRLAGTVDTALMISRDTVRWTRVDRRRRFFPLGPEGSWESQMNFVSPEVVVGDRMLFYYSGWKKEHGASDNEAAIGLATLPLDRFVSMEPKMDSGSLTTKPFKLEGDRLLTNVETRGGELRIEVLNEDGDTIPGYEAASCVPITTDALRAEVQWRGESLKGLAGKRIRLRFHFTQANLFTFLVN
jgi:hypothetical protein